MRIAAALFVCCSLVAVASAQSVNSTSPSPSAVPSPAPTPTILMLAPDAPPQILWVSVSSTTPHAGDVVSGTVLTSSNVASVELRVGGYSLNSTKTDVGHFEWSFAVPQLPFYAPHDFALQIIARNTAGVAATTAVAMSVR
ncbi:MAG TPA: hypothetical protein VHS56_03905 [Candidatus Cybelea sp.]|nr:hypothetical protein [Candidatus Cybelea sp.]